MNSKFKKQESIMAIHEFVNFNKAGAPQVSSDDTLIECMLGKFEETEVFTGLTGLTVIGGNCINCIFPSDTIFGGCTPDIETPNIAKNTYTLSEGRFHFLSNEGKMSINQNQKITKNKRKNLMKTLSKKVKNKRIKGLYKKEFKDAQGDDEQ